MASLRKRHCLIFLCSLALVTIHHVQKAVFRPRLEKLVFYENIETREEGVTCQFPIFHPFHESILHLIEVAPPVRCYERNYILTLVEVDGVLRFNRTALEMSGYDFDFDEGSGAVSVPSLNCFYQEITRPSHDDFNVEYGPETRISGNDQLMSDFVYVQCNHGFTGIPVYKNFHAHVIRNPQVRQFKDDTEVGVMVIGIDSMSRLNFMRQLSLSYKLITQDMNATVMLGFNKVGENTWPNVMAMLTGRPTPPYPYHKYRNFPFVWNEFASEGAATMYSEDLPEFNMFDYLSDEGIELQPTLHYMRTFWLAAENSFMYKMSSSYCLGMTPKHIIYFNYLLSFLRVYKDSPVFLFSLFNELSHDYVNTVGALDGDFFDLLRTSFEEHLFNRSVVIVLGDHGNRIDPIRVTPVGRIEDLMPMVSFIVPEWFHRTYPMWKRNLDRNRKRFTASHDLFATFRDVLSTMKNGSKKYYSRERTKQENTEFLSLREQALPLVKHPHLFNHFIKDSPGLSLFQTIPKDRDCQDAGVPPIFCTCNVDRVDVSTSDERCLYAANQVIDHFNDQILKNLTEQCARQVLSKIISCRISEPDNHKSQSDKDYILDLTIETKPGGGIFEATAASSPASEKEISKDRRQTRESKDYNFQLDSNIFRVNAYGEQASCLPRTLLIAKPILKGVCYCV